MLVIQNLEMFKVHMSARMARYYGNWQWLWLSIEFIKLLILITLQQDACREAGSVIVSSSCHLMLHIATLKLFRALHHVNRNY